MPADDFLAEEEDVGEEGGGDDPNAYFDYGKLAEAIQADRNDPDVRSDDEGSISVGDDDMHDALSGRQKLYISQMAKHMRGGQSCE